jgi:hypothetical protein
MQEEIFIPNSSQKSIQVEKFKLFSKFIYQKKVNNSIKDILNKGDHFLH